MKQSIIFVCTLCSLWLICLSGCQTVDDPYYTIDPQPLDTLSAESFKKVLLEDYTGILCVNCPEAAKLAEEIAASSRHRVIVMAVHAGYYAIPGKPPYTLDLRCPEGETYLKDFNINSNPAGVINRMQKSAGMFKYSTSEWAETVKSELQQSLTFQLKAEAALTDDETAINATVFYTATTAATTDYNLIVFLVEDGIIGAQDGQSNPEYVFHNVLRETLHDDPYGMPIKPVAGVLDSVTFENYKIKSIDKKAENSTYKLIVAITQRESRYIEQVEEIGLK
ncbi:MAG: Omp28-related outer membrane protein [Bacteroidales bacterium]|nr:Omp28-related outer membrane protein [Bacteroidales bacterium]